MKSIVIAAPHSGSGKTTVTLGIMACLRRRGLRVAPFKVGPDFIDPGYHRLVCGGPSANLDGWMCGADFVRGSFCRHSAGADIAVVEGVMGLFDGLGAAGEEGSTAQVAKFLRAPVLLVVEAKGMARSVAALVKGFVEFDPEVSVAGVIFNGVASDSHARLLREVMESALPAVRVVGCLPRDERLQIPSRHLGLLTAEENPLSPEFLDHLVETMREHLDLGLVWELAGHAGGGPATGDCAPAADAGGAVTIAVARDEAFCFVYDDNLCLLRRAGAELVEFSPLRAEHLPAGAAGLYLPGGYPELFADALAANGAMRRAVREAIEAGMPAYAECGGFIYLTRGVSDPRNDPASFHEFAGIFPVNTRMLPRRKALGYREVELLADTVIGPAGTVARGHEFHYSEMDELPSEVERAYRVSRGGTELGVEGVHYRNCLASYVHLHFGSNPGIAAAFVANCRKFKSNSA
ncbi:cobyrinate a,c-diamide synthase [Geotalea uraniireducens]|uniref:Cobyrinate a,c-diamide synthase n=1 Tax=Geotalea uraniireducens TaxID=351604 RepID=A0ABN6VVK7_9BACT|nr:cobyrinate a,c-diamide synthase [Geotalea uraniireducens]BDV44408.1 cobyrinate a,c-diamide synthase [Geotalea uraniireducens]